MRASNLASTVFASNGSGMPFSARLPALVARCYSVIPVSSPSLIWSFISLMATSSSAIFYSIWMYFALAYVPFSAIFLASVILLSCYASSSAAPSRRVWCAACCLTWCSAILVAVDVHACSSLVYLSIIYLTASSRYCLMAVVCFCVCSYLCSNAFMALFSACIFLWSCIVVSAVSMHFVASAHSAYFCSPTFPFSLWKCSHICSHPNTILRSNASCLWWFYVNAVSTNCSKWLNFSSVAPNLA